MKPNEHNYNMALYPRIKNWHIVMEEYDSNSGIIKSTIEISTELKEKHKTFNRDTDTNMIIDLEPSNKNSDKAVFEYIGIERNQNTFIYTGTTK